MGSCAARADFPDFRLLYFFFWGRRRQRRRRGGCRNASGDSDSISAGEVYEFCAKNIIMTAAVAVIDRSVRSPMELKLISISEEACVPQVRQHWSASIVCNAIFPVPKLNGFFLITLQSAIITCLLE